MHTEPIHDLLGSVAIRPPLSSAPPAAPATPSTPPLPADDDPAVHTARALMSVTGQVGTPADAKTWWMRAWAFRAEPRGTAQVHSADITQWAKRKPEVRVVGCVGLLIRNRADILVAAAPVPRRGALGPRVVLAARHVRGPVMVMRGDVGADGKWAWTDETERRGEPLPMMVTLAVNLTRQRLARVG